MRYLIFDTETGGMDAQRDALLSIAAIVIDDKLSEIASFYTLIRNDRARNVSDKALEINGLSKDVIKNAMDDTTLGMIWTTLLQDVEVIIAHNIAFDAKFIKANWLDLPEKTLDTMHLAWDKWPGQKAKLGMCYERIGGVATNAHNALYDCQMTLHLLRYFVADGFISLPLPSYPVVENYYSKKAFGYDKMKQKGLL